MAVRFNGSGDEVYRTANLPSDFTVCGYAVRDGAGAGSQNLSGQDNGTGSFWGILLVWDSGSGNLQIVTGSSAAGTSVTDLVVSLGTGTPFFWAMTRNASSGDTVGYYRALSGNTLSSVSHNRSISDSKTHMRVGNNRYDEWWDGRAWNVKAWDRVLTSSEILVESYFERPKYPSSINFWWKLNSASDTADRSGNGRNATVGGSIATGESTFNPWTPRRKLFAMSSVSAVRVNPISGRGGSAAQPV